MRFEIELWGIKVEQEAATRSKARYHCWLRNCDVLPISFGEFCKQSRIRRLK